MNFAKILIILAILCSMLLLSACNTGNTGNLGNGNEGNGGNVEDNTDNENTGNEGNEGEQGEEKLSPYMEYYISQLENKISQYNGVITTDWSLPDEIIYPENRAYNCNVVWNSSDANVFSDEGKFTKQTYDKSIILTAYIHSYLNGDTPESSKTISFTLLAKGAYSTPTKEEVVSYLQTMTNGSLSGTNTVVGGEINCDLNLVRKISNAQIDTASGNVYEVRVEWEINNNGVYEPISQIQRGTSPKTIDLVATVTFNGMPLEDDGKVYFDDVALTPVTEDEIRRHVINQIASKVSNSFSTGDALWAEETIYGCEIKWISKNIDVVTIEENKVNVNEQAVSGTSCPITVQVSYPTDSGSGSFSLEYVVTIDNPNNTLLQPGPNMSESLYYALLDIMREEYGHRQLTTAVLKNTKFVSLDLSKYNDYFEDGAGEIHPPITDLTGLTYCENLRLLNISGLNIETGISEIAGLTYLESLIAKNVGFSSEDVGGTPIFSNMINLKLVDLSNNNLTSLDMFFSEKDIYSKLKELYLNDNDLADISLLTQAPLLETLTLSNNNLTDISALSGSKDLKYLSLNNNNISNISPLKKLTNLEELRLHCNDINDISALKNMTSMKNLYLSENNIDDIGALENLTNLEILYLNGNKEIADLYDISNATKLKVLNFSDCSINHLNDLIHMSELKELYAENNEITAFDKLTHLSGLEKLLLAGNLRSGMVPEWNEYLSGMANLKVLTLSGLDVNDLSFLVTESTDPSTEGTTTMVKPIKRLEIAGCGITSVFAVDEDNSVDNINLLTELKSTLIYLDISNNPIEQNISLLGKLSSLEVLYADNINIGHNIIDLMANSQSMKYISFENCNISNLYNIYGNPWLSTSRKYVFIDLAGNPLPIFNFDFVRSSASTLECLYVDTTLEEATLASMTKDYDDSAMINLSLEGFKVNSIDLLPDMNSVEFLNLRNTQIKDMLGELVGEEYLKSVSRYSTLKELDLGGNDGIFTKDNLDILYNSFNASGATVYLYSDTSFVGFDREREIKYINDMALQDPNWVTLGGDVVDYRNSQIDNNPSNNQNILKNASSFNGFDIVWTIDDAYLSINNNVLNVVNIALPSDSYDFTVVGHTELYGDACTMTASGNFTKGTYIITYYSNPSVYDYSHRETVDDSRNVTSYKAEGQDIVIYDPTRGEYDYFLGWYEDENFEIPFANDLKDNPRSLTLYAKWDVATYYDSIDETPFVLPQGRVVIDWSKEADTNLLNHTNRSVVSGRYNNIDIYPQTEEIVFIGNPTKTYKNFIMHLCGFEENHNLTIKFIDFKFESNEGNAIGLWESNGVNLTIDITGDCSIVSKANSGNILGLKDSILTLTGNGALTLIAGDGADSSGDTGNNGGNGGHAIICKQISIGKDLTLNAHGGDGGDGAQGTTGSAGADGTKGINTEANGCKDAGDGTDGGNGGDGGKGGNGGHGGNAISAEYIYNESQNVTLVGGDGGDGGKGGTGGKGGNGGNGGDDTCACWFKWNSSGDGGDGGDGGKGGNGGTGGNKGFGCITSAQLDGVSLSSTNGSLGDGGAAGDGGAKGGKGYRGDAGSNGDDSKNGSDGTAGGQGSPGGQYQG